MIPDKKKQKSKSRSSISSSQLEIRIPRVQKMEQISNENEKTVKISHLSENEVKQEINLVNNEIKKRLDVCHEKLMKNNELLAKAAESLKSLNFKKLRKQCENSMEIDTADCLQQDEEELKENRELIQKKLDEFRLSEQKTTDEKVDEPAPLQDFSDSLKVIVETFTKITEQISKQ